MKASLYNHNYEVIQMQKCAFLDVIKYITKEFVKLRNFIIRYVRIIIEKILNLIAYQ